MVDIDGIGARGCRVAADFFVQLSQHTQFAASYDCDVQEKLVTGNWYRTVGWSVRGFVALLMLWQVLSNDVIVGP